MLTGMTIFELPAGQVYDVTTGEFICAGCGSVALNVQFKGLATDRFVEKDGVKRRCFLFHNPVCHCDEGIWLTDGPVNYVP